MLLKYRKTILSIIVGLSLLSVIGAFHLKFRFDFEQFFPEGDDDLLFYQNFIKSFESDNNFILIGLPNNKTVFEERFLKNVRKATNEIKAVKNISKAQSLTTIRYPIKTPFGFTSKPMIDINKPEKYEENKKAILEDPRFVGSLIDKNASSLVIALKTNDDLDIEESKNIIDSIKSVLSKNQLPNYHIIGRANFQYELVRIQQWEFIFCTILSLLLVIIVIKLLYYRWILVGITLLCVFASLLFFVGGLSLLGRELSLVSALYPVIILIVSTSDIIHIMTKYIEELKKGLLIPDAIKVTLKEVGLSTFITSVTTALGFIALITSKVAPVRDFGINCAIGVLLAFIVTVPLVLLLLSFFKKEDLVYERSSESIWDSVIKTIYLQTFKVRAIVVVTLLSIIFSIFGLSKVSTNYSIKKNLPLSEKVGQDFLYFEENFNGFRPLEFAVSSKNYIIDDFEVAKEIDKLENKLSTTPSLGNIISPITVLKSYNRVLYDNVKDSFKLPATEELYLEQVKQLNKISSTENNILVSKDKKRARISTRVLDIGADSIKALSTNLDTWIDQNIDKDIIDVRQTGTGLILDKNSIYVKDSLLWGLLYSVILVSILMGLILKDWKIIFIALVPNVLPLMFIGGLLGWLNIELEAGISVIFGLIYGIVVDDTIHFFGRYNIARKANLSVEESIKITFDETGKALIFTTLILFFAFLVMLFTAQPLTQIVGILLSITFIIAVVCDLYLLPMLLRTFIK